MIKCKLLGHKPELFIDLDTKEISLKCIDCGKDRNDLLELLEGESMLTIPSQYTIYRKRKNQK